MAGDRDQLAHDHLPAYEAKIWTQIKLQVLASYLAVYAKACKRAGGWYALDLFAGPGLNIDPDSGHALRGSPLIALEAHTDQDAPYATKVVAIERNKKRADALAQRTARYGNRCHVLRGAHEDRLADALALIDPAAPIFSVIDPEGFEVAWSTLERLAAFRQRRHGPPWKMEMLLLFPSTSISRLREEKHHPKLRRVFGSDDWRIVLEKRFPEPQPVVESQISLFGGEEVSLVTPEPEITDAEAVQAWVGLYAGRFRSALGYEHALPIRVGPPGERPKYHLIFVSDHPAAPEIMRWAVERAQNDVAGGETAVSIESERVLQPGDAV